MVNLLTPQEVTETAAVAVAAVAATALLVAATYQVTKSYFNNPTPTNAPNRWTIGAEAVNLGVSAYNSISNWLSSDESGSTGGSENSKAIDWNNPPSPENLGEEWQETTSDKNKSGIIENILIQRLVK